MAGKITWNGDAFRESIARTAGKRIDAASIYLVNVVKADISQPGTLRYSTTTSKGKARQRTVYNFTHSRPGMPPFAQTKYLRRSITRERIGLVGRIGTNAPYGLALELGTRRMAARPFLRPNLIKHRPEITAILTATIKPGELPAIVSNQYRSGHFGAGAREAGFA